MPGPWEKYGGGTAAPDMIIKPRDPYKDASETRAVEDQQLQRAKFDQQKREFDATHNPDGSPKVSKTPEQTGAERKAAGFVIRAQGANENFGKVQSIGGRSLPGQAFADKFPNAANTFSGSERQLSDNAQREFIASVLRLDSGAAIPPEELVTNQRIYFPQPGDGPEVLKQKEGARFRAINSLRIQAGQPELPMPADTPQEGMGVDDQGNPGLVGSVTDDSPAQRGAPTDPNAPVDGNSPGYQQIAAGVGDIVQGVGDTVGILANPIGTSMYRLAGYNQNYDLGQILRDASGLPNGDPTISAINRAATSGLTLGGGAAAAAGRFAPGVAQNALAQFGANPMMDMATGASGAGAGEYARASGAGPVGQAAATIVGGATPSALTGARNGLNALRGSSAPADFNPAVVEAGARQNIPIRRPDAAPSLRGDMANAAQTQHGGPIISTARHGDQNAVEGRIQDIGGEGAVRDNFSLGRSVQGAADRHIARTRAQATRLYDRARELAGDARVTPRNADASLDQHIRELREAGENTNAGAIRYLEGLRSDIDRGLSIEAVQNLRTNMRGQINERNLTGTDTERRVGDVITAMNRDLAEQLPDGASQALDAADQFYRGRMEFIKQVSQRFVGAANNPVSAETAAQRLLSMVNGKGDASRFTRMWRELEPGEQADLSATIASSLGRKANGEFSLSTLVRSLDPQKGINPRLARIVFGDEGARALADLRSIAAAKTATQAGMNNSNTGATVTRAAGGMKTLLLAALGYSVGGTTGAIAGGVSRDVISRMSEQRAARLLLNPDFTRWLRNAPNTANPQAINGYFRRLATNSAKAPVFAGDVKAFQQALAESFSESPMRAAAQGEQEQN